MIISVPKEIMSGENRVACVPDVVPKLIKAGFEVQIEKNAGLNAGFTNEQYQKAGAKIIDNLTDLYANADLVFKVQRPIDHPTAGKNEIDLMKKGTILISFRLCSSLYRHRKKMCRKRNRFNFYGYDSKNNSCTKNGCTKFTGKHCRI